MSDFIYILQFWKENDRFLLNILNVMPLEAWNILVIILNRLKLNLYASFTSKNISFEFDNQNFS